MSPIMYSRFVNFLKEELLLSNYSIAMANRALNQPSREKSIEENSGLLPMVLWQYGLVTLEELDRIYDWLETA